MLSVLKSIYWHRQLFVTEKKHNQYRDIYLFKKKN